MSQIIEIAVRTPKPGKESAFVTARDNAVDALLAVRGVGPERPFEAIETEPAGLGVPAVGTTRYADSAAQKRATRNPRFLWNFLKFMRTMTLHLNVLLQPDDTDFDLVGLADGAQVVRWVALTPKASSSEAALRRARAAWLDEIRNEAGVSAIHTFESVGGFKGKDSDLHAIVFDDIEAAERIQDLSRSSGNARALADITEVRADILAR